MKKVGQMLKAERERRHLSLHEIGLSLKINPKILSAIEEGDLSQLPAKTFLRGFVRSYAQYLKMNVDEVVKLFHEEMGPTRPEQASPAISIASDNNEGNPIPEKKSEPTAKIDKPKPTDENPFVQPHRSNRTALIVVSAILVILIVIVARLVEKYQKERQVSDSTVGQLVVGQETSTSVAEAGLLSTTTTELFPSTSSSVAPATTSTSTSTSTTSTTTTSTTTTSTTIATKPKATPTPAPQTTTTVSSVVAATGKPVEVIVEALNKVTINYKLGADENKTIELSADQVHTFKSKSKIELEISDGGAVSLIVNGRERGVPGTIGKPVKLNFPQK